MASYKAFYKIFLNPIFWIILISLIKLININLPPLDEHSWRQAITLGVAWNYLEWDNFFFYPRTILCDSRTGIQGQEFPIYNYLIYLGWFVFGQENWVFRIINILISGLGLFWFHKIVIKLCGDRAALFSLMVFACSIAFSYSRKAMPDTIAVSLALGGVYYGWQFLMQEGKTKWHWPVLFILLSALGMLVKIPSAVLLSILVYPMLQSDIALRKKIILCGLSIIPLLSVVLWYFVWVPHLENTFEHHLYYPRSLSEGFNEIMNYGKQTIDRFEELAFKNKLSFYVALIGLIVAIIKREYLLLLMFLFSSLIFFFFMVKTGHVFSRHEYYVIPYIPIMSIFFGYGLDTSLAKKQWLSLSVLLLTGILGLKPQLDVFTIMKGNEKYLKLEELCDQYFKEDARILTSIHDGNPMMLYMCGRRGWSDDERWKNESWLKEESSVGLEYAVIERFRQEEYLNFPVLFEDEDFIFYSIKD